MRSRLSHDSVLGQISLDCLSKDMHEEMERWSILIAVQYGITAGADPHTRSNVKMPVPSRSSTEFLFGPALSVRVSPLMV